MKWYHYAALIILLGGGGTVVWYKSRGLRNNNPGNIELGDPWQGRVPEKEQTDTRFVQFVHAKWGIRAMARIIDNYRKRGVLSVDQIISTWAPPTENNTAAYISSVYKSTGWPSGYLPVKEEGDYVALIKAIIKHENGINPYSDELIKEGISMA